MKLFPLTALLIGLMVSCSESSSDNQSVKKPSYDIQQKASWLIGRWENNSNEGHLSEIWKRENDSLYTGNAYFVVGKDTVFREQLQLITQKGSIYYIATVSENNDPVSFKLTSSTEHQLVFENPTHDFPQIITYTHRKDSIIAVVSGKENGKPKKEVFTMKKVN